MNLNAIFFAAQYHLCLRQILQNVYLACRLVSESAQLQQLVIYDVHESRSHPCTWQSYHRYCILITGKNTPVITDQLAHSCHSASAFATTAA